MKKSFDRLLQGYLDFRDKYAHGDDSVMRYLSQQGQKPEVMVIACCDSRVDPALILQADPGELFVVRNVANIVPPYEKDAAHHGTSAALEFAICYLEVKHLILLGHSQCGGIEALLASNLAQDDFITSWVSIVRTDNTKGFTPDDYAKASLQKSQENCLTFPWIKERLTNGQLRIHQWFFEINQGQIFHFDDARGEYRPLSATSLE